jgi:hypothetical protein
MEVLLSTARAAAEELMTDECTIAHHTGQTTGSSPSYAVTQTYGSPFYTGPCKVQAREVEAATPEAGDRTVTVLSLRIDLPMSVTGAKTNDLVTITSSAYDSDLAGRTFRVLAPFHKSQATARRLSVEEVVS